MKKQNTVFAVGKSIIDRSSQANVGQMCLKFGGGGHMAAGTCQVENSQAESIQREIVDTLREPRQSAAAAKTVTAATS